MDKFDHWLGAFGSEFVHTREKLFPALATASEEKDEWCPMQARTCSRRYPSCCVPDLGKLTFSQFWDKQKPIENFTIHGLWPSDCRTGQTPDSLPVAQADMDMAMKVVDSSKLLKNTMRIYWPSSNGHFWANEWKKHGTYLSTIKNNCFGTQQERDEMYRYFLVTLSLYSKYNVMRELSGTGVVPGRDYTREEFFNAMPEWRESMRLYCTRGELSEIRFNLHGHPYFKFSDRSKPNDGNCPEKFHFPKKVGSSQASKTAIKSGGKGVQKAKHDELK